MSVAELEQITPQRIAAEVEKRRTFAIISHPDAGKTPSRKNCCSIPGSYAAPVW